jgi:Fur family ferric uptake transcriptional regulator
MSCFQTLKEKGYKLTPQRVAVLEVLHESDEHITAADIYQKAQAKYPQVNKSTVYRTLELMKELRLVTETNLGGDRFCYHHAEKGHHHHLICQRCGKVVDLDEAELTPFKELLTSKYNFIPEIRHLAIFGYCLNCKE